jgi:hypothetical protein
MATGPDATAPAAGAFGMRSLPRLLVLTAILTGAAYLLTRHAGHTLWYVPFLVFLACPIMHMFMHRHGHRSHS